MKFQNALFESGKNGFFTDQGCSPLLLSSIRDWLHSNCDKLQSVDIALYIFNNDQLYQVLKEIALKGVNVTIFSIPLDGYDRSFPKPIYSSANNRNLGKYSKYDLAQKLYSQIESDNISSLHLRIFDHVYLRSPNVKPFSRGNMPYSLHCKTCLITMKTGEIYAGLTSSNLAVRDTNKHELSLLVKLDNDIEQSSTKDFFACLLRNSYEYNSEIKTINPFDPNRHPPQLIFGVPPKFQDNIGSGIIKYTAPFYKDSAFQFDKDIRAMVNRAKSRIIVCAQHVCAYNYTYNRAYADPPGQNGWEKCDGFLTDVLKKAKSGVKTTFLSQTYVDRTSNSHFRKPVNTAAFLRFSDDARKCRCKYYANPLIHAKFIVADDTVLVTTANFTPSQFIYLPNVHIPKFENMNGSYDGVFCEIGAYCIFKNKRIADWLVAHTEDIIHLADTICCM